MRPVKVTRGKSKSLAASDGKIVLLSVVTALRSRAPHSYRHASASWCTEWAPNSTRPLSRISCIMTGVKTGRLAAIMKSMPWERTSDSQHQRKWHERRACHSQRGELDEKRGSRPSRLPPVD